VIHRATANVNGLFQKGDGLFLMLIYPVTDGLLIIRKRTGPS
jgi:hypothetical protein